MLFDFFKKQNKRATKVLLLKRVLKNLKIPDAQKELYENSLEILWEEELDKLYENVTKFVEKLEVAKVDDIKKNNFASINGLRKKEAEEKKEELNSMNFLLNNV